MAALWNEPYGRSVDEIGRLTVTQVLTLLRPRDARGRLQVATVTAPPPTPRTHYVRYLRAIGITDRATQQRLWAKHQAEQAAKKGGGRGV